jgi:hypothetical protein
LFPENPPLVFLRIDFILLMRFSFCLHELGRRATVSSAAHERPEKGDPMPKTSLLSKLPKALAARLRASDRWFSRDLSKTALARAYERVRARG